MKHLAIIMDGNRRWAQQNGQEGYMGHRAGADNIQKVVDLASKAGIQYLTLWGLSTENLKKRSIKEVTELVKLIVTSKKYLKDIQKSNGKIEIIGDLSLIPKIGRISLDYLVNKTKHNTGMTVILAIGYGGKDEIIRGIKKFIQKNGNIDALTASSFENYLDTGKYPPADMIIRTGGDIRHSGFLLYQSDYSEYYFTKIKWPDFGSIELSDAMNQFKDSQRNFGK